MSSPRKPFRSRITPSFVISVLALVVALGGTATANGMIGSPNIKKNAVKSKHINKNAVKSKHIKNKTIKVADLSPAAINALSGKQGVKGEQGAPGISGYHVVRSHKNFANADFDKTDEAVAKCDAGEKVIGGGAQYQYASTGYLSANAPAIVDANNDASIPSVGQEPNGWYAQARKTTAGLPGYLYVWVICANVS